MIVFDLHCLHSHRFEGWFASSRDFDDQQARGLLTCPVCGSLEVGKAPMAPAVPVKSNARALAAPAPRAQASEAMPAPLASAPLPPELREAMVRLAEAQAKALKHSTWVGTDFAEQSRAMHYGERDEAPIHGQASLAEARALIEEGVPVAPLPFPVTPPDKTN